MQALKTEIMVSIKPPPPTWTAPQHERTRGPELMPLEELSFIAIFTQKLARNGVFLAGVRCVPRCMRAGQGGVCRREAQAHDGLLLRDGAFAGNEALSLKIYFSILFLE